MKVLAALPKFFISLMVIGFIAMAIFSFVISGINVMGTINKIQDFQTAMLIAEEIISNKTIAPKKGYVDLSLCRRNYEKIKNSIDARLKDRFIDFSLQNIAEKTGRGYPIVCGVDQPLRRVVAYAFLPVYIDRGPYLNRTPGILAVYLEE